MSEFHIARNDDSMFIVSDNKEKPALKINSKGIVTENYRPFFSACLKQNLPNQTISAQPANLIPDRVISNIGGHYNATSGKFRAPVDGVYTFTSNVLLTNLLDVKTDAQLSIIIGRTQYRTIQRSFSSLPYTLAGSAIHYMEKGEEAWTEVSAAVQSFVINQAIGFGGDPSVCQTVVTGYLT